MTGAEGEERALEEFLRGVPPEAPDAHRKAAAREAFLAGPGAERSGDSGEVGSRGRRPERMGHVISPEHDEAFEAWLRASGPHEAPRDEVRRRARLALLSQAAQGVPELPRVSRSYRWTVWLAAAAAILVVTFLPREERWRVRLDGRVDFAEEAFFPGDGARLAQLLEASGTLEPREGVAHVALGDELELDVMPGSSLVVPPLPRLDGVSPIDLELARGETHVRTAASWPGNPVLIRTPDAEVALTGTTVGVLVDENGTCVCVAEGTAMVSGVGLPVPQAVGMETTLFVFRGGAMAPKVEPFPGEGEAHTVHTGNLVEFRDRP